MCRHLCLHRTSCIADRAADHECMHERRACRLLVIHQPKYTPNASSIELDKLALFYFVQTFNECKDLISESA
ncbi:hypothetical protein KQX54_002719 [Cotesia glomerata]|uniref:Uncharacterized protein n=1 Tax=Cotesia glomerata TaxID=32391 RepID=A0AAV7J6R2_COTGL|nr:hypothetical protein KQX54_002719 [Cotesia glomerata]